VGHLSNRDEEFFFAFFFAGVKLRVLLDGILEFYPIQLMWLQLVIFFINMAYSW
jgi:hypothetical protein